MTDILRRFGITRYDGLLVSCDHKTTKQEGLFGKMKEQAPAGSAYLHIGDHPAADGEAARENGMDAYLILSPLRMMELSAYARLLVHLGGVESRVMLGLLMSEVFNDPFALYRSEGRPRIGRSRDFGYVFLAPLVVSVLTWMFGRVKEDKDGRRAAVLFSARDGWLLEQLYRMMAEMFRMRGLPKSQYLLISRQAVMSLGEPGNSVQRKRYQEYLEELHLVRKADGSMEPQGDSEGYEQIYFLTLCQEEPVSIIWNSLPAESYTVYMCRKATAGIRGKRH